MDSTSEKAGVVSCLTHPQNGATLSGGFCGLLTLSAKHGKRQNPQRRLDAKEAGMCGPDSLGVWLIPQQGCPRRGRIRSRS